MRKVFLLLVVITVFMSCKNDAKIKDNSASEDKNVIEANGKTLKQNDGLVLIAGSFIYYADAAVIQTHNNIYGVVINDKMHELNKMAKAYQKEPTDYVSVQVRGKLIPKPEGEEGWPYRVDIKEIESVKQYDSKDNDVIKLGTSKTE